MKRINLALACCLLLASCGTPEPVRDLAEMTSANVGLVSSEIKRLATTEQEIAKLRAESLANYAWRIKQSRAALALDVATTKKVDNDAITRKVELEDWIKDAQVAAKPVGGTREEIVERILATQKGFSPKSDQLMTVAKTLAKLAKKETVPQRVDFLTGYTKDVLRLIKANQAEAEAAVGEAKNNKTNLEKAAETLPTPSNDNPEMN